MVYRKRRTGVAAASGQSVASTPGPAAPGAVPD